MSSKEPARRAEPGQEFGYTGNEDVELEGDEVPEGAALLSAATPDAKAVARRTGVQKTLKADKDGVVHPRDAFESQILDSFGLPVAREKKSEAAEKSEAASAAKE